MTETKPTMQCTHTACPEPDTDCQHRGKHPQTFVCVGPCHNDVTCQIVDHDRRNDEAKHTPGPWEIRTDNLGCKEIGTRDEGGFFTLTGYTHGLSDEAKDLANARLIASAPEQADRIEHLEAVNRELVEACEQASGYLSMWDMLATADVKAKLDKAIAKS